MRVKAFQANSVTDIEKLLNNWIDEKEGSDTMNFEIKTIKQSISDSGVLITVWYRWY